MPIPPPDRRRQRRSNHAVVGVTAAALLASSACGLFDPPGSPGKNPTGPGATGFGAPTLEITVSGTHFGPASPDPSSGASFVNTVDSTGRLVQSALTISALTASVGTSCQLTFERDNPAGVAPIGAASYLIDPTSRSPTPDGQLTVPGTLRMTVPGYSLYCAGTDCNGSGVQILGLDSAHVEGYVSGTWPDVSGAGYGQVVCSFYVPMARYQP